MIREALRGLWQRPWLTLAGALLGVLLAPTVSYSVGALTDLYYLISPISRLYGTVLKADAEEIVVHLKVDRSYAPGCNYLMLRARTIDAQGEYELARIERLDQPSIGDPLPPGRHDAGIWRIVPRSDGVRVSVTTMYDCGGRIVGGVGVVLQLPTAPVKPDAKA